MKKVYSLSISICLALCCLTFALPSFGWTATYYIGATGGGNGSSPTSLQTLSWANSNLQAGDTVYLRTTQGNYTSHHISPTNGGTSGNPITYQAYTDESPYITGQAVYGIDIQNTSYIVVNGIHVGDMTEKTAKSKWFYVYASNHITIKNCTFDKVAGNPGWDYNSYVKDSSYVYLIDNSWDASETPVSVADPNAEQWHDLGLSNSSHVLVLRGTFAKATHANIYAINGTDIGEYSAIIDCTFNNDWHTAIQLWDRGGTTDESWWLVEGNTFNYIGRYTCDNAFGYDSCRMNHSIEFGIDHSIIRENIITKSQAGIDFFKDSAHNRIYHNTIYDSKTYDGQGGWNVYSDWTYIAIDNKWYNNIFWKSDKTYQFYYRNQSGGTAPDGSNELAYNLIGNSDGTVGVYWWTNNSKSISTVNSWTEFNNGISVDPQFSNPDNGDFTPQSASVIDVARPLTLTNSSGFNSTRLVLDDAAFFFSGAGSPWLLENTGADTLYIEDTGSVTIASIDYSNNTITLTTPATWGDNKKVYHRPYNGSGPDIGAYESGTAGTPQPQPPPPPSPEKLRILSTD